MADENIDFSRLQKEFYTARHADEKYTRENDAKFRAVHQKVGSYEEFRDIVTASHLKPLDRDDITGKTQVTQPWNPMYTENKTKGNGENKEPFMKTNSIKSKDGFLKSWNSCTSKVDYLLQFDRTFLSSVFEIDIPFNMLEQTLDEMNKTFPVNHVPKIAEIMLSFTTSKRFALTLKFLGKADKEKLKQLLKKISEHNYDIRELQRLYDVEL